jgi:hypothetical protein
VAFGMDGTGPAFVASLTGPDRGVAQWHKNAWRPTLRWLYLALLMAAFAVAALASGDDQQASDCAAQRRSQLVSQVANHC